MTDFKIGDRVRAIQDLYSHETYRFNVGDTGVVSDVTIHGDLRINWDNPDVTRAALTGPWFFEKIVYAPGTRIRGYFEGVVDTDGKYISNPNSPSAVYLNDLTDITPVKTLPTAPGSVISYIAGGTKAFHALQKNGRFVSLHGNKVENSPEAFDSADWTIEFDAGAK